MTKLSIFILLAVALFAALSLIFGAPYLDAKLIGGLPVGNVLAAIGLCAGSCATIGLSARGSALRSVSVMAFVLAASWLPLSIALAGNLDLNFSGSRGDIWLLFSLGTLALVLIALLWSLAYLGYRGFSRKGNRL
jgi:hypothetical protein